MSQNVFQGDTGKGIAEAVADQQRSEIARLTLQEHYEQKKAQMAEAQQKAQRQQVLQDAFAKNRYDDGQPDFDGIVRTLTDYDPEMGVEWAGKFSNLRKEARASQLGELQKSDAEFKATLPIMREMNPDDPESIRVRLPEIAKINPELAQRIAQNPESIPELLRRGLSQAEWTAQQAKITDIYETDPLGAFLKDMSISRSQEDMNEAQTAFKLHAPKEMVDRLLKDFGPQWTPETPQRALQHAMTVAQTIAQNKPTNPPNVGSFEDYVTRKYGANPTADQVAKARQEYARAGHVEGAGATSPVAVIGPDGKPVFVRPNEAYGRTPASTREQGRPVTSGDANRIADFDTSLDDIKALSAVIGNTGTVAKIQSWMPQWVNELTGGWSDDAKSRNAVIARVKQVIGKALEGGVLRKEDEEKYKDILPTIYDSKAVAASKLSGLRDSLVKRRQTLLDSLNDAGFETGRYQARPPRDAGAQNLDVSEAVRNTLAMKPAGEYDLSDGHTYRKDASGKITVVK